MAKPKKKVVTKKPAAKRTPVKKTDPLAKARFVKRLKTARTRKSAAAPTPQADTAATAGVTQLQNATFEERVAAEVEYIKEQRKWRDAVTAALLEAGIRPPVSPYNVIVDQLNLFGQGQDGLIYKWSTVNGEWKLHKDGE